MTRMMLILYLSDHCNTLLYCMSPAWVHVPITSRGSRSLLHSADVSRKELVNNVRNTHVEEDLRDKQILFQDIC